MAYKKKTKKQSKKVISDSSYEEKDESKYDDNEEEIDDTFEDGWDDEAVKAGLLLIGLNNSDKSARDNQNLMINNVLKEASLVGDPIKPRYVGAKKLKQAITKTAERVQMPGWGLQGDGADEDLEILITKAAKEILHRGKYDSTFSGKGGIILGILQYGNKYRLMLQPDKEKTNFPVEFKTVDGNNLWMSTSATSFRGGNKNVTRLVALFRGTVREFDEEFPQYAGKVKAGLIPRTYAYKDLDQTASQNFAETYAASVDSQGDDNQEIEWAYMFDITKKCFTFVAGADLKILEKKEGDKGKDKYPYFFINLEGKKEYYIPVSNYMCIPAEEGIYDVGLGAYLFDLTIIFRRTLNQVIGHVEENAYPHTLVNIPQGQEASFFNLIEMANQMRASGNTAYVPITYNPNNPAGNISSANPITNGGDMKAAQELMNIIEDEFRKVGVYLDEPLNADLTEQQIALNASNASVLPKAMAKYNAPEIEFEINVFLDMCKKYIKTGDKTPLILDTTVELPDTKVSIRGIPFTLGWFKEEITKRAWRPKLEQVSGAVEDNNSLLSIYKSILPSFPPGTPQYEAVVDKIAFITGVKVAGTNPVSSQNLLAAGGEAPPGPQIQPAGVGAAPGAQSLPPAGPPGAPNAPA